MQFDQQYPAVNYGFKSPSGFFKGKVSHDCRGCRQRTTWIHTELLLYFCSAACHDNSVNNPRSAPPLVIRNRVTQFDSLPECRSLTGENWQAVAVSLAKWEWMEETLANPLIWPLIFFTILTKWECDVSSFAGFGPPAKSSVAHESIVSMLRNMHVPVLGDATTSNGWSFVVLANLAKERFDGLEDSWRFGRAPRNA